MNLNQKETEEFHVLMKSLMIYAGIKLETVEMDSKEDFELFVLQEKYNLLQDIYSNINIIDDYIKDNPNNFNSKQLSTIKSWKNFKRGPFYIERYLKNYAIFVSENDEVYAVNSLVTSFSDSYPKNYLPLYLETVLLPFNGKVIYDGFTVPYDVSFGSGLKKLLKDTYMKAKMKDRIIFSLADKPQKKKKPIKKKDWSKEIKKLTDISKTLKGGKDQPMINSQLFALLKRVIELTNKSVVESSDIDTQFKEFGKVVSALKKVENTLYLMDED